ncbi:MAG: Gfo/Idh/MocA family oxidoreductase [Planctomycetota bacterium]|nr:Gfo/Idh/MocA family oxidoreductase [Planctomycetota bacterium]
MPRQTRRSFLHQTTRSAAAMALGAFAAPAIQAQGANQRIVVGVVGCARGCTVGEELLKQGAKIAYACDPDQGRVERAKKTLGAEHAVADFRKILDDRTVDAVVIAAPDHWHAPAAILACQAGKHVYVEKPCSHSIHEGRRMIEAARRSGRVMQVGTQTRSTKVFQDAIALVREGAVGKVLIVKTWTSQQRVNIGHCQPSTPPAGLDYDLWVGPAPMLPFQTNRFHYTWHWWTNFGTGDAGNRGAHQMDVALWGLDMKTHPTRVAGFCGKMYFDDDQQFPDTQYVTFEYPGDGAARPKQLLVYEQRIWTPYVQDDCEDGCTFYGDEGYLTIDMQKGWQLYGRKNALRQEAQGKYNTGDHAADFLDAIRSDRRPNADIEIGHLSATLAHLSNLLARTGRQQLTFDPKTEQIIDDTEANALTKRTYREGHWADLQRL